MKLNLLPVLLLLGFLISPVRGQAQSQKNAFPAAPIVHDEGGPVALRGQLTYSNPLFTVGVAAPMVILEDQAGFIDRNEAFVLPKASQTLGQITSDFYSSPVSYPLPLPLEPQASLRDVDHNGRPDRGRMAFAVAYWTNIFGDPFLEERDLFGGGWSTAYASTRVSDEIETRREVIGGKLLVYAPDDQQGFPSDFGADGLLFTADDPIVGLPAGYSVVDLDARPFGFDRSRYPVINLIEPDGSALTDFSAMSYSAAFDAMIDLFRTKYAFTEYKKLDWNAISAEFRPRFVEAEQKKDVRAYLRALRDFTFAIPDGHVSGPVVSQDFQDATIGGVGMAIRDLDDGRTIVNFLTPGGPAEKAGIKLRAQIITVDDRPVGEAIDATFAWSGPFSSPEPKRLQQLRYVLRGPLDSEVKVRYRNPGASEAETVTLTRVNERQSFDFSSFESGRTGAELPVDFKLLDNGYGYVRIYSFADNDLLSVQLWERMIRLLKTQLVPGLIIDLRQNGGGSGFLADQMAAYFFDQSLKLGNTGYYDQKLGAFYFDPRTEDRFYLPTADLRYHGKIAVLIGPNCKSACEFFAYDMSRDDRSAIVGQYSTAGLGGSVADFKMPGGQFIRFTIGRGVDMNGNIHVEGKGVAPTIRVPVNEETLFSPGDPVLEAGKRYVEGWH